MIFVAEFVVGYDVAGTPTTATKLVSTAPFATKASETPASTPAYGRLMQPGNFVRSISGSGSGGFSLFGLTRIQHGEVIIANADGLLDEWATYGVGDRLFTLRCKDAATPGAYPSGWTTVFVCTMDSIRAERDVLKIVLKEKLAILDKPMCDNFTGAGGVLGPSSLTGSPRPKVFGSCYNVSPVLIDSANLIYLISSRGSVLGLHPKDDGSVIAKALTTGDDGNAATADLDGYETYAALAAATVPIGHSVTVASLGLMRLGSEPAGVLTVDAHEYTGPAAGVPYGTGDRWAAGTTGLPVQDIICYWGGVIEQIALDAGWASSEISAADKTAASVGQFGYYARDASTTYAQAIDAIASSAGAWAGADREGTLRFQRIVEPATATPGPIVITRYNAISLEPIPPKDGNVPTWKIVANAVRNWTPQSNFAGIVPENVRAEASREWAYSDYAINNTVKPIYPNAQTLEWSTYVGGYRATSDGVLQWYSDANASINLDDFITLRQWFEVKLPFTIDNVTDTDIGDIVTVEWNRFGLDAGKQFLVVGLHYELSRDPWIALTLWG